MGEKSEVKNLPEINPLIKIVRILWNYRKFLIGFNFIIAISTIGITLLLPKWYTAKTTVIIKETEEIGMDLTGQVSGLNFLGMGLGPNIKIKKYIALLKSESICDSIIQKFNLKEVYKLKHREDIYKALNKNVNIVNNEDGTISIYCTYKGDPVKAAEMANEYARLLIDLDTKLSRQQSTEFRQYIEENYKKTLSEMKDNEKKLLAFQKDNSVIDLYKQTELLVQQIAELEIQRMKNDIEIRYLKQNLPEHSPAIQDLVLKNQEISKTISDLYNTSKYNNLPVSQIPEIAIDNLRVWRDLRIQEKVIEFLVVQLEKAKVQENKNFASVMVLDKAVVPERKSKPKRASIVIITTFFSCVFSLFAVSFYDFIKRNKVVFNEVTQ